MLGSSAAHRLLSGCAKITILRRGFIFFPPFLYEGSSRIIKWYILAMDYILINLNHTRDLWYSRSGVCDPCAKPREFVFVCFATFTWGPNVSVGLAFKTVLKKLGYGLFFFFFQTLHHCWSISSRSGILTPGSTPPTTSTLDVIAGVSTSSRLGIIPTKLPLPAQDLK